MGNNKNRRKDSHSDGGANGSRPRLNSKNGGGRGGKGRNNNDGNGENQKKGRVPQDFSECRICERRGHWESDCRKNSAGEGKRGKGLPECRECGGNHWEDQCRNWKSKGAGNGNNNSNYTGKGQEDSDSNSNSNSHSGECLAPSGEDITRFFPNGKYPNRPCKKCKQPGHWNNVCEKDGFHPVANPNPGGAAAAAGARKVGFPDGQSSGQIDSVYNQYHSPPGTQVNTGSTEGSTEIPPVGFGYRHGYGDVEMAMQYEYTDYPNQTQTQNQNPLHEHINPNTSTPDYLPHSSRPQPYLIHPGGPNPDHPSHPDSSVYQARYRSSLCTLCQARGHKSHDCVTYRWLLPRTHNEWRPHSNLHHPSNTLNPRPDAYWTGDPMKIPSRNTYIWPHPENRQKGARWGENQEENGGRDVWVGEDDREGKGDWGMPPGGCGGEENGGLCRFDWEGDVLMVDILDLEERRWRGRRVRDEKERAGRDWWNRE